MTELYSYVFVFNSELKVSHILIYNIYITLVKYYVSQNE